MEITFLPWEIFLLLPGSVYMLLNSTTTHLSLGRVTSPLRHRFTVSIINTIKYSKGFNSIPLDPDWDTLIQTSPSSLSITIFFNIEFLRNFDTFLFFQVVVTTVPGFEYSIMYTLLGGPDSVF